MTPVTSLHRNKVACPKLLTIMYHNSHYFEENREGRSICFISGMTLIFVVDKY